MFGSSSFNSGIMLASVLTFAFVIGCCVRSQPFKLDTRLSSRAGLKFLSHRTLSMSELRSEREGLNNAGE